MSSTKKSRKQLYGYVTENLEDDDLLIMQVIGSAKISKNKKIDDKLNIKNNSSTDSHEIFNIIRPKIIIKDTISTIKTNKIIISHHKSNYRKKYFGSKTNKKKIIGSKKKFYDIIPSFQQCNETKNFFTKKN